MGYLDQPVSSDGAKSIVTASTVQSDVCEGYGAEDASAWPQEKLPTRNCGRGRELSLIHI
eukprot:1648786-Alexandrium_andersonii.AAC.1